MWEQRACANRVFLRLPHFHRKCKSFLDFSVFFLYFIAFLRRSGCVRTTPAETGAVILVRFGANWRVCRRVVIASVLATAMTAWQSARGAWEGSGLNRLNRSRFFLRCDCVLNTMHFCRYASLQLCTAARRLCSDAASRCCTREGADKTMMSITAARAGTHCPRSVASAACVGVRPYAAVSISAMSSGSFTPICSSSTSRTLPNSSWNHELVSSPCCRAVSRSA